MAQHIVELELTGKELCPTCPYCEEQLTSMRMTVGSVKVSTVVSLIIDTFSCPSCGKVLSVSGRK